MGYIKKHTFKFRTGDTDEKGGCTFIGGQWVDKTTDELFKGKRIVLFSLPGAFTPTCSGEELPSYDRIIISLKKMVLMMFIVYQLMTHL